MEDKKEEKKIVKIYVESSIKGPCRKNGAYGYVIVFCAKKGKADTGEIKTIRDATRNQAILTALNDALKRITKPCYLTIYTDVEHIAAALKNNWPTGWKNADWKNAKGEEIVNKELWSSIQYLLNLHDFKVALKHPHEYKSWLTHETEKKAENEKHI